MSSELFLSYLWQLRFNDPTLFAWLTVFAYLMASILCTTCILFLERIFPNQSLIVHRLIWAGLAVAMLFLGANKQLDLQSPLTRAIKGMAYRQGWAEWGQLAQVLLVTFLGAFSILVIFIVSWSIRKTWKQYWILLIGLMFLARFIIVRVASIYGVSLPELSQLTGGLRVTWLLEILGAMLVAIAAAQNLLFIPSTSPQSDMH